MLVKLNQAHRYRGPAGKGVHGAQPATTYLRGAVLEMPADYFERALEPYGFAEVLSKSSKPAPAAAAAGGALPEDLDAMTVIELRELATAHGILDAIEGTGANGRVLKADLIEALEASADAAEGEE